MPTVRIETSGFGEVDRNLRGFASLMTDLRPFWPLVVPVFIRWMSRQFETEGAWGGQRWASLSPEYAIVKAERYPGKGILIAEGDMRQAASRPRRTVSATSLILEIEDPKIEYHQDGTPNMPARPVVPSTLPSSATREIQALADQYVLDALSRFGLSR